MDNPEIGSFIDVDGINTNYHDCGNGDPVILLHGSGPGVSAWANWRLNMNEIGKRNRVIAPDIVGFGFTQRPENNNYSMNLWVNHIISFMDKLGIETASIVGNSFGGALALALAVKFPKKVHKLILMGSVGIKFKLTKGLNMVWGYEPSISNMRQMLDLFTHDRSLVDDELAELRYKASVREGFQESYSSMFPAPRQRWVDAMSQSEENIKSINCPTLIIHGREDVIVPIENSTRLFNLIKESELHLFGKCGHWTQIEHRSTFNNLVSDFLHR